jgi:hypothetical protein
MDEQDVQNPLTEPQEPAEPPPQSTDLKAQFEALDVQKRALWDQIKHIPEYDYESTPEWAQICEIDKQLLALDAQIKGGR